MSIPSAALAAGWIPFVVTLVLILLFSGAYVKYFISKRDGTISSTLSSVVALSVTLLTTALIPVDVFLVSFMKNTDGTFKDWAVSNTTRQSLENSISDAYYSLYGLIVFCLFLLLPFMYFFYEERDEESTVKSRMCSAFKYTLVSLFIIVALLLVGAFVGVNHETPPSGKNNTNQWNKIVDLFKEFSNENKLEDALSFVVSVLSLLGMLALIMYSAYGMSAMPMSLIKGTKSAKEERLDVQSQRSRINNRSSAIRDKYSRRGLSSRNRDRVEILDEEERLLEREEKHLEAKEKSLLRKCLLILRPFEVVFGVAFFLVTLLIFVSLLLTNIDKAIHGLGYKSGYALPKRQLPNPVDIILVFCQKVFPLDYIMFAALVLYLVFCSMSGVRNIGIWFLWLRMYKIRPRRTRPQGILMMCMIMMFLTLAINIIIYELTPQYSSFGSQRYVEVKGNSTQEIVSCTTDATANDCTITRMTLLLTSFFYRMWFFGAAYYWGTWVFLGFILIGFVISVIKKRKSSIEGEVERDDFDDSDEELLTG
ncbi:probable lysosomal cobalamin transporter [Saccostrea echinata]|uniref:probable lysosomal cobalamin transporter n=1 Tax=Saccostrea echinata TaxID=191078 RepID=UPI002A7EF532|nr:probable lysosomal cobalamin transporter [Saccostrea echinata]